MQIEAHAQPHRDHGRNLRIQPDLHASRHHDGVINPAGRKA
jgi:hypothetical protein